MHPEENRRRKQTAVVRDAWGDAFAAIRILLSEGVPPNDIRSRMGFITRTITRDLGQIHVERRQRLARAAKKVCLTNKKTDV